MNPDTLIVALVQSRNEAADDVLLDGLRIGSEREKPILLSGLIKRKTIRGLGGVVAMFDDLPPSLQGHVLANLSSLHHALIDNARGSSRERRLAAMRLIAQGRDGKLAYILTENVNSPDEMISRAAVEALVALARWISSETSALQRMKLLPDDNGNFTPPETYGQVLSRRLDIESAIARAMDMSRGRNVPELLQAALLLCDWPGSKILSLLQSSKHGGHSPMVRRLQQPPAAEHVSAFLLGATHGQLRSHFGSVFSHIAEAPVLDAMLSKTHWLKDEQLRLCMKQVTRGAWFGEAELLHDIGRRSADEASLIAQWIVASGVTDVVQDERLDRLRMHAEGDFAARLRVLRCAMKRPAGSSCELIKQYLGDADERLVRLAARELVRRKPAEYENCLMQRMTAAPLSVRRIISRSLGEVGFDNYWQKFDALEPSTRKQAGRAMLKLLPDAISRLRRRLETGPAEQRLKGMQIAHDLELSGELHPTLSRLTEHPNARVRAKAVNVLGRNEKGNPDVLVDRVLADSDARVRASAIEMVEAAPRARFMPVLAQRARSGQNRERANSIKALHRMKVSAASEALLQMLRDPRPEHRVSAMWVLRQVGWWKLLSEVGRLAKEDQNLRVRRYALGVLRSVADLVEQKKTAEAAA